MTYLDISSNKILDAGGKALASMLAVNKYVTHSTSKCAAKWGVGTREKEREGWAELRCANSPTGRYSTLIFEIME